MTRRHLVIATLCILSTTAFAQEAPGTDGPLQTPALSLTVAQVVALHQASVDDSVILAKLEQQHQPMPLTTDELIRLKGAGVSDAVVRAMLVPPGQPQLIRNLSEERLHSLSPTGATLSPGAEAGDINNPLLPHDSGIYMATAGPDGAVRLTYVDRITASGASVGGMLGAVATFGVAPMTMKYNVPQARAVSRTSNPRPVFYFYFEDHAAGLGKTPFAATVASSPSQFQMERMKAGKKERQLLAAKVGITGAKTGGEPISFQVERLHAGLYKVTPDQPLKPGEYCFVLQNPAAFANAENATGTPPSPDIFDFAIDKS